MLRTNFFVKESKKKTQLKTKKRTTHITENNCLLLTKTMAAAYTFHHTVVSIFLHNNLEAVLK